MSSKRSKKRKIDKIVTEIQHKIVNETNKLLESSAEYNVSSPNDFSPNNYVEINDNDSEINADDPSTVTPPPEAVENEEYEGRHK